MEVGFDPRVNSREDIGSLLTFWWRKRASSCICMASGQEGPFEG